MHTLIYNSSPSVTFPQQQVVSCTRSVSFHTFSLGMCILFFLLTRYMGDEFGLLPVETRVCRNHFHASLNSCSSSNCNMEKYKETQFSGDYSRLGWVFQIRMFGAGWCEVCWQAAHQACVWCPSCSLVWSVLTGSTSTFHICEMLMSGN